MEEASVVGKIIIQGKIHLMSPLIIGSGKDDYADIEVLKDVKGIPYIPATSVIGVLKHYFYENFPNDLTEETHQFWGFSEKVKLNGKPTQNSAQSAFVCHDLDTSNAPIMVRDGVKIDPQNQVAKKGAKYDYEIVDRGAVFNIHWEVTLRKQYDTETFKRILATIIELLKSGTISFGAKTNSGFGKCKLKDIQVSEFDFSKKEDVLKWLKQDFTNSKSYLNSNPFLKEENSFCIEAKFAVKNSIIVRSYSEKINMPDAMSISSNGAFVLPGTSIKGAIRNRATRILKTLYDDANKANDRIDDLFGIVVENGDKKKNKSRVLIEERKIERVNPELQNRIKIDRFTGGTVKTALFNSMPLWPKDKKSESVTIVIRINKYKPWEAGLMLQVLKDLWCEDLPIGGEKSIGRGVLQGISANIKWDGHEIVIKSKDEELEINESIAADLEKFANSLVISIQDVV